MAPGASHGRARVPAPAPAGQRPAQQPATGRARVGAPPAKGQGRAAVPPAKKAPAKKAAPPAGNPERRAARARESNAGGAVLMLMGASSTVNGNRMADTVMADVRRAQQRDAQDGGSEHYDQAVSRAAGQMARALANERGGSEAEKRHLENRIKRIAEEAMRSGNVSQLTALKRELSRSRTASASPDILALYGLQLDNSFHLWGDTAPALVASPLLSLAHLDCNLSVFCRNPLHPGPCKGWKNTLAKVAPGTLKLIEEERKKKLAAKQAAKAKAQAAAKKIVDQAKRGEEVDAHPAAKKKLAAKATAQILGDDEEKVTAIEGKTKLSQKEIAWHAQKKAAALLAMNLAAGNLKGSKAAQAKYRAYVRKAITEALKKDNETGATGPDSEYQKTLGILTRAQANSHADKFADDTTDEGADLHTAVAEAFDAAMQADLANQKPGVDHPSLKKLTKALEAIPGKPGDPEHDKAVAAAVGLEGWEPSPNAVAAPDTPAADAPTPKPRVDYSKTPLDEAGAAQYGDTIAGVAAAMGSTPEAQAAGKANVAKMMNGKAPSDTPQLQGLVSKMAIHAGQTIAGKGTLLGTGAAAQIQDRVQAEMKQMLAEGLTEPPPGGILAAMKSGLKGEDLEKAVIGILKKDGVGVALKPAGIKWDEENPNGVAGPSAEAAPALPEGALPAEDADKLAKGAEQVALLTSSPQQAASGAANAKKLAQSEGFTDKQTTMVMKTATNQAGVAAGQNYEGLDGFSPQGKKKFEKVLAAEMVEMLETGGSPKPGSLAELVAMKKAGAISADDFHAEVMKKLKIKSKKLNPDGSSKAAPVPAPAPSSPTAGGAGSGGSLAKSQGAAASALANAIGPHANDNGAFLGNVLSGPDSDQEKAEMIDAEAGALAANLMVGLPVQSLSADEYKALESTAKDLFKAVIEKPDAIGAAEQFIKAMKAKNGPETKKWAAALVPAAKSDDDGGSSAGGSSGGAGKAQKKESYQKANAAIMKSLGEDPEVADDYAEYEAGNFDGASDQAAVIKAKALTLATDGVYEGNGNKLPPEMKAELIAKTAAVFEKAMTSGDPNDIQEAEILGKTLKIGTTAQLANKSQTLKPPTPDAASGPGTPVGTSADPGAEAAKITAGLQAAYEKLTGDDGSALSSTGAQSVLADAIKQGASPQEKAKQAAVALAGQIVAAKVAGKSGMPILHQKALANALAKEIEEGILSGNMDGEYIKSLSSAKGGFTKIKIKGKQAYEKMGAGPPDKPGTSPLLPTSSKDAALDKALDDAFGPASGTGAPTMPSEVNDNLVDHAAQLKGVPQSIQAKLNQLADEYNAASPANKPAAADALAQELAATALGNLMDQLDILGNPMIDAPAVQAKIGAHLEQVKKDYLEALNAGADAPGGLAGALSAAVKHTQQLADDLAAENAYDPKGAAVSMYKVNTVTAMLDLAASTNAATPATTNPGGGAGAGGTGTGVTPVTTPAAPNIGPAGTGVNKPKVNVAALPKGTATYTAPTAPPPPATPTASTLKKPKKKAAPLKPLPPAGPPPDLAGAKKVGGQGGSNPGAQYETDDGTRYYVKQQKSAAHARNEAMASALYREAGVETPPVTVQDGTVGELSGTLSTSQMVPGATPLPAKPTAAQLRAIRRGFAVDAWLGNWDVAGLSSDNIILDANGNPVRIDLGGSLEYRAQGSPKGAAFGDTVGEIDTLRSSTNPSANKLFGGMSDDELIDAMEQVEQIDPQRVRDIVAAQGGDPELAEKLIRRRQDIIDRLKKLREAKEYAEKNTGPLGVPDTSADAGKLKLGGEPKKQLILKPKPPNKVSQVVLEGHEGEVYEYNERVANSRDWTQGAEDVPIQMGSIPKTSPGYQSLKNYTSSSGCSQINGHLRAGGQPSANPGTSTSSAADRVAQLDATFEQARLTEPITVLRGFGGNSDIFGDLWTQHRDRNWAGAELRDLAYSSSTVSPGTACAFAGCGGQNAVVMRIHMPAGTRAINLGGNSLFPGEAEILLNRGARFRIVADNGYQDGARRLDVEVICDGDGCADTA
jgi:hypothetical protein